MSDSFSIELFFLSNEHHMNRNNFRDWGRSHITVDYSCTNKISYTKTVKFSPWYKSNITKKL